MTNINDLRKLSGLPPLEEVTDADVRRTLDAIRLAATEDRLDESVISTLKAILSTVNQSGARANVVAAEEAKKLPGTVRAAYKEAEVKDELRHVYRKFMVMLTQVGEVLEGTKNIQEKDPEMKRELDLYVRLMTRTIRSLQARAGASSAVKEAFTADELDELLEQFMTCVNEGRVQQVTGGYRIDGEEYVSDEAEALVDEAKQMAYDQGKRWEDILLQIAPKGQLKEAKYVAAEQFHTDFYSLFDSLKALSKSLAAKKALLHNWMRSHDFKHKARSDEMFRLFSHKLEEAVIALKACEKNLQKAYK